MSDFKEKAQDQVQKIGEGIKEKYNKTPIIETKKEIIQDVKDKNWKNLLTPKKVMTIIFAVIIVGVIIAMIT